MLQGSFSCTDGSPLPEDLPGFTGRLAMTVSRGDDNTKVELRSAGPQEVENTVQDRTGLFNVKPGLRPVVVRLEDTTSVDTNHFYLHLDAQPMTRSVDFTGRAAPPKPDFSISAVMLMLKERYDDFDDLALSDLRE